MKKKFAFIIMGRDYDPEKHRCQFETDKDVVMMRSVRNLEEAKQLAVKLRQEGVGAIELCGAFGEEGAREVVEATDRAVAVGYVIHDEELGPLFAEFQ